MFDKLKNYLALAAAYVRFNVKSQLEYRTAFISQAVAMFINDCAWLAYFIMLFDRFPIVRGWHAPDVATLWAVTAAGFGIGHCLFGNSLALARIITNGELDTWLLYPRALLPHVVLGRMNASSFGDAVFGYVVYFLIVRPDLPHMVLFTSLTFSVALLFLGFSVLTGSLSFYVGNGESLSEGWRNALIAFSTYPTELFDGKVKLLLFTLIPAAFVSGFPVEALQKMSLLHAAYSLGGALTMVTVAVFVFHHGLKRYESGNMVALRG
ncbi:MAG: ABC-2 family transporter protein [Candidatus Melainabacteria bacterium]|nr:ABC-2 family transporter protein [Candidatus Melainabacteria bacterium]